MIIELIVLALVAVIGGLVLYARWHYGSLEKLGIPVVKPHWILGSLWDAHKYVSADKDVELIRNYGDVIGVYDGRTPQVWVADPEMIKHITVKDYEHFSVRREQSFGEKLMDESLDIQSYPKWKLLRQMLSPLFAVGRLKAMNSDLISALNDYSKNLDSTIDSSPSKRITKMDMGNEMFEMVADIIARTLFSLNINNEGGKALVDITKQYVLPLRHLGEGGIFGAIVSAFPFLIKYLPFVDPKTGDQFLALFKNLAEQRRNGPKRDDTFGQAIKMLDLIHTEEYKKAGVTDVTVMAQAVVFFVAGQDQFATVLATTAWFVSQNPQVQAKLEKEIDDFMARHKGEVKHEDLGELPYTNACLMEAVRLVPTFTRPERLCTKDWTYGKVTIKKGTCVTIPLMAVNRHPDHFANPDQYDPERFMPGNAENEKRHPYAFSSFGHGPKNCIAYRYTPEVLKITAAKLFHKYRYVPRDDTKLELKKGTGFLTVLMPLYFDVERRN